MNIENEIFKRSSINFNKLEQFGFKKETDKYTYEKEFLNNDFKAIVTIDKKGNISGKVIDLEVNEEYTNIRTKMTGKFVNEVKKSYKDILKDIRNNCFETNYFIFDQSNRINKLINNKYNVNPEFLWEKFPGCAIYRNKNNNKWFSLITNLDRSKLDNKTGEVEIINVKLEEDKIKKLLKEEGFYEAYHMNKINWISIILNDTVSDDKILSLVEKSYNLIEEAEVLKYDNYEIACAYDDCIIRPISK